MTQWAVVNERTGEAIPVSNSELGAKQYATRRGYNLVCQVSEYSMSCYSFKRKKGNKWIEDNA